MLSHHFQHSSALNTIHNTLCTSLSFVYSLNYRERKNID